MILTMYHDGNEIESALPDGSSMEEIQHVINVMTTLTNTNVIINNTYQEQYEQELAQRQQNHLDNLGWNKQPNWRPCMHDQCAKCHGTGISAFGPCIHMISCPCPKCSPTY